MTHRFTHVATVNSEEGFTKSEGGAVPAKDRRGRTHWATQMKAPCSVATNRVLADDSCLCTSHGGKTRKHERRTPATDTTQTHTRSKQRQAQISSACPFAAGRDQTRSLDGVDDGRWDGAICRAGSTNRASEQRAKLDCQRTPRRATTAPEGSQVHA